MAYFAGFDVSVKETRVCIVDDAGRAGARVASEPEALLQVPPSIASTCLEESRSTTATPTKKCHGANTTQRHFLLERFFIIAPRPNCQCSHSSLGSIRLISLPSFGVPIVTISPRL
jgi:hypothetical protein